MVSEYFSVELSPEINLGIPLSDMGTVVQFETNHICTVPGVADFWYGVVNYKGSLLWVLDSDRFFNLVHKRSPLSKKLTAVILKHQLGESQRQIGLVTPKLVGIISPETNHLQQLTDTAPSGLRDCCTAFVEIETRSTYILNSANLLQLLHQKSTLVSV
ncbi:chemotaxis protein CheW [Pleurocapsa sp. PCC 7319]|uniref:chemotaxis protein CheW n=1 Tax=Pleurocapsa sp. PCC 7319 TaxID=118161 RepID=UPI00034DBEC0|nr:chemotaxis protein CheW [Pleurocapsa sp. PCC 7319]